MSKYLLVVIVLISQFTFSQEEEVEKHPLLTDKFVFNAGIFFPDKSLKLTVDGKALGDEIDWGDNFDIKNYQSTFALAFDWRFKKKWSLSVDWYEVNNASTATLDEPIFWEDLVFRVGAEVKSGLSVGVVRAMVGRTLSMGQKHEFGVGIGFHVMYTDIYLEGQAFIEGEDESVEGSFETGNVNFLIPLPDIGLWYTWAPTPRWAFSASTDVLYLTIDQYSGYLWDIIGGVNFQVVDFFGVGLNYRYYTINLEVDKANDIIDFKGSANLTYNGPMLMVNFNF